MRGLAPVFCLTLALAGPLRADEHSVNHCPSPEAEPRATLLRLEREERVDPALAGQLERDQQRADALIAVGQWQEAVDVLRRHEGNARLRGAAGITHHNLLGQAFAAERNWAAAMAAFDQAAELAAEHGGAVGQTLANSIRARLQARELSGLEPRIEQLLALAEADGGQRWTQLPLSAADLLRRAVVDLAFPASYLDRAVRLLEPLQEQPEAVGEFATGFLGAIARARGDFEAAGALTRTALTRARATGDNSRVFRWQWQLAQIAMAQGDERASQALLTELVALLEAFGESVLPDGGDSFDRVLAPIYRSYAGMLLSAEALSQDSLREARNLLDELNRSEVEDYFASRCLSATPDASKTGESGTAVLHVLILDDRIELILEHGGQLRRSVSTVDRTELIRDIRTLRLALERPGYRGDYRDAGKAVYDRVIAPVRPALDRVAVDTLVIVPDGPLRTIPFAALFDGSEFLVERFALATTPAVGLLRNERAADSGQRVFAGGLSESVQGFSALPNVGRELDDLSARYPLRELRDDAFQLDALRRNLVLPELGMVHLATHGEFNADHRNSFLLTYDNRLTLPDLKSLMDRRVGAQLDLLVLSACQTASGDDRAALGLAGIAVQTGARSAVASLWSISDASTAELFRVFYDTLKNRQTNKAESLRQAQLALLRSERFSHPTYWAPYLLVGSAT